MKRYIIAFLAIVVLTSCTPKSPEAFYPGCDQSITESQLPIVITAIRREANAILELVDDPEAALKTACNSPAGSLVLIASFHNVRFLLMNGIVGPNDKESANEVMNLFEKSTNPQRIIYSGIGGGLGSNAKMYQTFAPYRWIERESGDQVAVDPDLLYIAGFMGYSTQYLGVTADEFVCDGDALSQSTGAVITDMESYDYALAAYNNQIPFIAIRTVSDMANCKDGKDGYQKAAQNSALAALRILEASEK